MAQQLTPRENAICFLAQRCTDLCIPLTGVQVAQFLEFYQAEVDRSGYGVAYHCATVFADQLQRKLLAQNAPMPIAA